MFEGVLTCKRAAGVGILLWNEAGVRPVGVGVDVFMKIDLPNSRICKGHGYKHEPLWQLWFLCWSKRSPGTDNQLPVLFLCSLLWLPRGSREGWHLSRDCIQNASLLQIPPEACATGELS